MDLAAPNPERDFGIIRDELEARDPRLLEKTTLVVANKIDLPADAENHPRVPPGAEAHRAWMVVPIRRDGSGLDDLREVVAAHAPRRRRAGRAPTEPAGVVVHRFDPAGAGFAVES